MIKKRFFAVRDKTCIDCGFCAQFIACAHKRSGCIGCGACVKGCPENAIHLESRTDPSSEIHFAINGEDVQIAGRSSVLNALQELGRLPDETTSPSDRCGTGGCWACEVLIDGDLAPACMTPVQKGMAVTLDPEILRHAEPKRVVTLMRPPPHFHPSIFTHGCNFNCDLCHNWDLTFSSTAPTLTPAETLKRLNLVSDQDYWVGISGGEPTLNRRWLSAFVRKLRAASPEIRIQLDTNASILTPDYIDELIDAGITDISPDLKAERLETFIKVTGVTSEATARRYLDTSWDAVRYIDRIYRDRVLMAVSVPCHPRTHSMKELEDIARSLASVNPKMPVTLIEYQPAFRLRDWPRVSPTAMEQVKDIFETAGLSQVLVQGGSEVPRAVDPRELALSSEEF
jgi:pyruvate formate lyase activating enzyme